MADREALSGVPLRTVRTAADRYPNTSTITSIRNIY